jgi:tetratricopeptide (TPR) repeat protein
VGVLAAILMCYAVLRNGANDSMSSGSTAMASLDARFLLMLRALGDYTGLIFFPARLHMERSVSLPSAYESASAWQRGIGFEYLSLIGAATLVAFACLCLIKSPGRVLRIFGAGWFMIGFLPVSNLFPLNAQVAEHWIYMPSIGFLLCVSGSVLALPEKIHKPAVCAVAVFALVLSARTAIRSDDWRDAETFYHRSMEASNATDRLELNLALVSMNRGDFSDAEKILRGTLSRYPDFPAARTNLGICLAKQGKAAEAEHWLGKSANSQAVAATGSWPAYLHLAEMRIGQNLAQDALQVLDEGIARFPDIWELTARKVQILQERYGVASSLVVVQSYADSHWWHRDAFMMLGRLRTQNAEPEHAIAAYEHASLLDIHDAEPMTLAAMIDMDQNNPAKACDAVVSAIHRNPDQPSRYVLLAAILKELKRDKDAEQALRTATLLRGTVQARPEYLQKASNARLGG